MPSAGATPTAAVASSTRCATPRPITSSPPTKWANRARHARRGAAVNAALRTASGGRIDRARVVHFSFDGRDYTGFAGDTLASALLANGVHLMGRSFKYHRPRGVLAAGAEEPNALVTVRRRRGPLHPEPARHPGRALRGPGSAQPEPLAEPRLRCRRPQRPLRALHPGRVLLQDLHVAAARVARALRAAHPRRRRPRAARRSCPTRTATPTASRTATCSSSAQVPRDSRPRRPRRPPARESSCAMSSRSPAARCLMTRTGAGPHRGPPGSHWLARRSPPCVRTRR